MKKITKLQKADLEALSNMKDEDIDLSDIPEMKELPTEYFIGKFYRPKKTSVTIRLDADVVAWMKKDGEGYQTRINTYLRDLMVKELLKNRRKTVTVGR